MSSLKTQSLLQYPIPQVIDNHITVQTAAEITGYNTQYLRRLLRAGKLEAIKIGQIWLISLASLQAYFAHRTKTNDRRCGPKCSTNSVYTNVDAPRLHLYTEEDSDECFDS